ncbi:MAG: YihY/virulence factor BrkB family protein [Sebaldella sp.]|nr:YihY/virulence factor BrkB family protein [Sebaldella sp.]
MEVKVKRFFKNLKTSKEYFEKQILLVLTVYRNYNDSQTQLWTASLTYYSILAIVPIIALTLGVTKGFGIDGFFEEKIYSLIPESKEGAMMVISMSKKLLDSTRGSVLTGVGVVILLWSILKLLLMLENAFNRIWRVKRDRSIVRRMIDYVAIVFIGPIFFAIVLTAISFFSHELKNISKDFAYSYLITFIINIAGFLIIIFLFTCIYMIIPNTKVKFKSALVAGISTTIMFFILKFVFFHVQASISKYNAIYGSLSFIPIFLIWVQYIWMSLLVGAQISFSSQNLDKYSAYRDSAKMPIKLKKELSILVVYFISKRFHEGRIPYSNRELSKILNVEIPVIRDIINDLEDIEVINEVGNTSDDEDRYQISVDPAVLTLDMVLNKIENKNLDLYSDVKINEKYQSLVDKIDKDLVYKDSDLIKDIDKID